MGSAARILDFHNVLSLTSSGVIRSACMSLRTQSIHLPLGLPLGLFPGTLMSTTALTLLFSSILCMCPYQRSLISLTISLMLLTHSSFLMSTLFTLSLSVTPLILRNILIPVFSRICSSFFLTVQHSAPYRGHFLVTQTELLWVKHGNICKLTICLFVLDSVCHTPLLA